MHPTVRSEGGRVLFVSLRCAESERRLAEPSRSAFGKLRSVDRHRELRDSGAFEFPALRADIELDTGVLSPPAAAQPLRAGLESA